MDRKLYIGTALAALFTAVAAPLSEAQDDYRKVLVNDGLAEAASLRKEYRFAAAADRLEDVLSFTVDSLQRDAVQESLMLCRNGESMLDFCITPKTIARKKFSLETFFLYYPLEEGCWRATPNALDPSASFPWATYIPDGAGEIYFSAPDEDGIRNIYITERQGDVWSAPRLLSENLTSSGNEIFPMLSPDGESLYFASDGLYGMGGYDIYVSRRNPETGEWGDPVNMGIPYSSPFDDFLFVNADSHTFFASNRDSGEDEVTVYVLEQDSNPVRRAIYDPAKLRALSALEPAASAQEPSPISDPDIRKYVDKYHQVNALKDSLAAFSQSLDAARGRLADASDVARRILAKEIARKEEMIPAKEKEIADASSALADMEMDLLMEGKVVDRKLLRQASAAAPTFSFRRNALGQDLQMQVLEAKPLFDYSFQILPEGRFAEDDTLPEGIVYQIQMFTKSSPATVAELKGVSPVFCRSAQGRFVYSAGIFRSYSDVLDNLNKVKKAGFKKAFIMAFRGGEQISVGEARKAETVKEGSYQVRIIPADGKSLGSAALSLIRSLTSVEVVRTTEGGGVSFLLGPYTEKAQADSIAGAIKNSTSHEASVEEL
ncbi:MAG: PD40 domain-containing protein [Bacteroidales bacterium]|nr:PD40 domain-containing protein [Bacteroidales bacterium]